MREKVKRFSEKIYASPLYLKFSRKRDKLAECIKTTILTFFNAVSPVWTFLCVKTTDESNSGEPSNEISQGVIKKSLFLFRYTIVAYKIVISL